MKNNTFSLEYLSNQISLFDFTKLDRRNKTQPLKIISGKNFEMKEASGDEPNEIDSITC